MMGAALIRKCDGRPGGQTCVDKWACARYYVPENAAGTLDPEYSDEGCLDFLRLAGHLGSPGNNGERRKA